MTPDTQLDTASIAVRKQACIAALEALHARRGAALLDGKTLPHDAIAERERELATLSEAEAEAARRQREVDAAVASERSAKSRQLIAEAETRRLDAIERGETACREMTRAFQAAILAAKEIRDAATAMGRRPPFALSTGDVEARLSDRLIVQLAALGASPGAFGALALRRPFFMETTDNWRDGERRVAATDIAALVGDAK